MNTGVTRYEVAGHIGVTRKVDPAELLNRRKRRRRLVRIDSAIVAREADTVLQDVEPVASGLHIRDRKPDEVVWRLAFLPVHRQENHAFAAVDLERKQRERVLAHYLEVV
jgi:hypothetical protein